jgi:C4-type Zn-finger protein
VGIKEKNEKILNPKIPKKIIEKDVKGKCLNCSGENLIYREVLYDVPNFGKYLLFSFECKKCGFIFKDYFPIEEKGNKEFKVVLKDEKALNSLIVRGEDCYIYFDNIGLEIKPIEGESFLTTFEGLIDRIERAVKIMGDEKVIKKLEELKKVKEPLIFRFKDKRGLSKVIERKGDIEIIEF